MPGINDDAGSFFYLRDALEEATPQVKIFAFETKKGTRRYVVRKPHEFFVDYQRIFLREKKNAEKKEKNLIQSEVRWHEVLRAGQPCRLYFDLEFDKSSNENISDGNFLRQNFVNYVLGRLSDLLGCHDVDLRQSRTLVLDASTDEKFSQHIVAHLVGGRLFRDAQTAGHFVARCCDEISRMTPERRADLGLGNFFVAKKNSGANDTFESKFCTSPDRTPTVSGGTVEFCDRAVYGRNKSLRIFLSSKLGKHNPFLPLDTCDFYENLETIELRQIFDDSLIEALNAHENQLIQFDCSPARSLRSGSGAPPSHARNARRSSSKNPCSSTYYDFELFEAETPEMDKMVLLYLDTVDESHKEDVLISEKRKSINQPEFLYHFKNYRFCQNVDRQHKNNKIRVHVNLRTGVLYQKCYDTSDCRRFKSPEWPILWSEALKRELGGFMKEVKKCDELKNAQNIRNYEKCQVFHKIDESDDGKKAEKFEFLDQQLPDDVVNKILDKIDSMGFEHRSTTARSLSKLHLENVEKFQKLKL